MQICYLTRRNLLTLLGKLDAKRDGENTLCTIIKRDTKHKEYPCSAVIQVTAVEDEDYYVQRNPGAVHSREEKTVLMKAIKNA